MFTGLVEQLAPLVEVTENPPGRTLTIAAGPVAEGAALGDSIAVNGCCLTVVGIAGERLTFEAGPETLLKTNLGELTPGAWVNLERSLRLGDRVGGHFVTGHVDARGRLAQRTDEGEWSMLWFELPSELSRQLAPKGSIAVDGVSLTLIDVEEDRFRVMLIPHTLSVTTLGRLAVGDRVNLETDLLAKYVARQLAGRMSPSTALPWGVPPS